MIDFRETLEVQKNSKCFFSWCLSKEDLAVLEENELPAPPTEVEFQENASLEEVSALIEEFASSTDKCTEAIQRLLDTGKCRIIEEY